jgi:hypothetical protein
MKNILDFIPFRFYDGEEGAGGGGEGSSSAEAGSPGDGSSGSETAATTLPEGFGGNVPKEFLDSYLDSSPELKENVTAKPNKEKPAKADDDTSPEDHTDTAEGDDKNSAADDTEPGEGEGKEKSETEGDDKNSATGEDEEMEFADDVIQGLKGEHLKALPKEARIALAEFYQQHTGIADEHKSLKERLESLEADPVVKLRQDLKRKGQENFDVRGITVKEKENLIARIRNKTGLDPEEAEAVFNEVEESIKAIAGEQAEDVLHNRVIEEDQARKANETISKGRNIFLQLGKFNKALAFKETDGNKFWKDTGKKDEQGRPIFEPDDKHPEAKLYAEKIVPLIHTLGKAGMNYGMLVKLQDEIGLDGIYAMVAKKHGLPVAINTGERDKKMLLDDRKKVLDVFRKGNAYTELTAGSGKPKPVVTPPNMKHGFDIVKLATDNAYRDRAIYQKPGDLKHAKLIERLTEEGDAYIASKTKK